MQCCDRFLYYYIHLSAPTLPKPHYPSKIANTFLAYERSVGFASVQSLWAFNFGHPCPSLAKGELLLQCEALSTIEGLSHHTSPLTTPIQNHRHRQSTDACNGRTKSLCTDAYSQPYQVTARCSDKKWLTMHGRSDHKRP